MKIHFLRDKTYIVYINDKKYLVNPYFGESTTLLPVGVKDILKNVVFVVVTDDFQIDSESDKRIKQKGLEIISLSKLTDNELKSAIERFQAFDYSPMNGEIILQEKFSC